MLRLFRAKNPYEQAALAHYQGAVARTRDPVFYQKYGVPDSFDGRFDLLLVHLFPLVHAGVKAKDYEFSQSLFDVTFHHLDQTLRQAGVGDVGVPKKMKKMMKAFNGRMTAYEEAWQSKDLQNALVRNLYGTVENASAEQVSLMTEYVTGLIAQAEAANFDDLRNGVDVFASTDHTQKYGT